MGGITKTLFGGTESETRPQTIPRLPAITPSISTGAGSRLGADLKFGRGQGKGSPFGLTGVDINASLAPAIEAIRQEALTGRRDLIGGIQGDIDTLRGQQNPFIQARVNPFIEQQERAGRDAGRRNVQGPLAALATNPFTQQIADQGVLATVESQQAIRQGQQMIQSLLADQSGEGQQLLAQEMALLGLGQDEIQQIIDSQLQQTVAQRQDSETTGGIIPGIAKLAGGIGLAATGFGLGGPAGGAAALTALGSGKLGGGS